MLTLLPPGIAAPNATPNAAPGEPSSNEAVSLPGGFAQALTRAVSDAPEGGASKPAAKGTDAAAPEAPAEVNADAVLAMLAQVAGVPASPAPEGTREDAPIDLAGGASKGKRAKPDPRDAAPPEAAPPLAAAGIVAAEPGTARPAAAGVKVAKDDRSAVGTVDAARTGPAVAGRASVPASTPAASSPTAQVPGGQDTGARTSGTDGQAPVAAAADGARPNDAPAATGTEPRAGRANAAAPAAQPVNGRGDAPAGVARTTREVAAPDGFPAAFALAAAQGNAAPAPTHALHAPTVSAPLASPHFAPEFSAAVVTLAKDQVQSAQLHLSPAEMGPVSVQLSLNGTEATVAFSAAQPDTRAAIEAALPVLKDMLSDSGLQLAHTSVSDHRAQGEAGAQDQSGGSQRGQAPQGAPRASHGEAVAATVTRNVRIAPAGRIDLYA